MEVDYNPQLGYRRTLFGEEWDFLVKLHAYEIEDGVLTFQVDTYRGKKASVKLSFLTETAFRFQMFPESGTEVRNPVLTPEDRVTAVFTEQDTYYEYGTEKLQLRFQKEYWEMSVYRGQKLVTREQVFDTNVDNRWKSLPLGYRCDESGKCISVHESMYLFSDEAFWGFGEKFTDLNKRGQKLHCWQKDALSTNTEDSYKGHPFFISSRGYAVLLNTYTRSSFDMGQTSQVGYQMEAEDGYLDYIFFADQEQDYKGLLRQYISLSGAIPMIPKWAFGFWMSKCTYMNRQEIEEVVTRALEEQLPMDVIHIDFWQKPDAMGTWEWDTERFPDPAGMIRWLKERHVHLSIWQYPYVTEDSPRFGELKEKGYFIKNKDGGPAMFYAMADAAYKAACFDFTNPGVRAWYKERIKEVLKLGVSVVKTDFSEAVPEDAVYYDGTTGIEGHNKITYLYAQLVYDTMKEYGKETGALPLLWGRSGYAGSHRIPAAWAGDSSSTLNNHAAILKGGLSLAMSGVVFWGYDLGGFYNTGADGNECLPSEEEYLRSVELGLFMPLSRAHGKTPREPWNYSEKVLNTVRHYDRLRHRLVPYFYSAACQSHLDGIPMLRPLLLEYPQDPAARMQELSCMMGDSLLMAPPFDREEYDVYLPAGKWLDLISEEILEGGRFIRRSPSLEELPVFQRENTILPMVREEEVTYVPEGSFRKMTVRLFYCSPMETVFYDQKEDGSIREYAFRAYSDREDRCLYVETDMDICRVQVRAEQNFGQIYLNGELQ